MAQKITALNTGIWTIRKTSQHVSNAPLLLEKTQTYGMSTIDLCHLLEAALKFKVTL